MEKKTDKNYDDTFPTMYPDGIKLRFTQYEYNPVDNYLTKD